MLVGCSDSAQQVDNSNSNKEETDIEITETKETTDEKEEEKEEVNNDSGNETVEEKPAKQEDDEQKEVDRHGTKDDSGLVVVDNPESLQVYVNKQRKLPDGYEPRDLVVPDVSFSFTETLPKKKMRKEAAEALEQLFIASDNAQLNLVAASGYRSYDRQKQIYESNVAVNGQEHADKFSAKPGTSEHQTGLAMDVTSAEVAFALEQTFKQTAEGTWLAENAHKFGFIIRYPEGKSDITGYSYEPWHIRYVGKPVAKEIYEKNITLEEYFGYDY